MPYIAYVYLGLLPVMSIATLAFFAVDKKNSSREGRGRVPEIVLLPVQLRRSPRCIYRDVRTAAQNQSRYQISLFCDPVAVPRCSGGSGGADGHAAVLKGGTRNIWHVPTNSRTVAASAKTSV